MRGPPGNPGQSCLPVGTAEGRWWWHPVLLLAPANQILRQGHQVAQILPALGARAGEALSNSRRVDLMAWLWTDVGPMS